MAHEVRAYVAGVAGETACRMARRFPEYVSPRALYRGKGSRLRESYDRFNSSVDDDTCETAYDDVFRALRRVANLDGKPDAEVIRLVSEL